MTAGEVSFRLRERFTARSLEVRDLCTNLREFELFHTKQKARTAFQTVKYVDSTRAR